MKLKEKLFGGSEEYSDVSTETNVEKVPIDEVYIHPANVRLHRDEKDIERVADSISKRGLEYPIRVVEEPTEDGKYGCYDGGFRLLACEKLGREKVPAIVGSGEYVELSLRSFDAEDKSVRLNPIEEARFFEEMKDKLGTYKGVMKIVNRSRKYVNNRRKLLNLPERIQTLIIEEKLEMSVANFALDQPERIRSELFEAIEKGTQLADLKKLASEMREHEPQPIISIGTSKADHEKLVEAAEKEDKSVSKYCYELLRSAPGSPLSDSSGK